jgi:AraC-like DNA-binding protein
VEKVNEFIHLSISTNYDIDNSYCFTHTDKSSMILNFGLYSNDCLFDLSNSNYEIKITILNSFFQKYNETLVLNSSKQSLCCNSQSKLLDIINCNLLGINRKIFIESQILFLLFQLQKNNSLFPIECESCNFLNSPAEIEKIQQAKKFILDNLSNNLTIPIVALSVGTNQCYLKKGFKEVFKQTIFEFIQENRMIKARHLLLSEKNNITDIASAVGYSSLSSFSQSYKNFFGITPTEQIKQTIPNL